MTSDGKPRQGEVTEFGKCLETGKRQNPLNTAGRGSLNTESVWKQENDKTPYIQKHHTRGALNDLLEFRCLEGNGQYFPKGLTKYQTFAKNNWDLERNPTNN